MIPEGLRAGHAHRERLPRFPPVDQDAVRALGTRQQQERGHHDDPSEALSSGSSKERDEDLLFATLSASVEVFVQSSESARVAADSGTEPVSRSPRSNLTLHGAALLTSSSKVLIHEARLDLEQLQREEVGGSGHQTSASPG